MSILHWLRGSEREPELRPDLKARLIEIEARQDAIERKQKALDLDWHEVYDKFRLLFARLSKRIKDWEAAAANGDGEAPQSSQDAPETTNARVLGYGQPPPSRAARMPRRNY